MTATAKKTTEVTQEQSEAVAPSSPTKEEAIAQYKAALAGLEAFRKTLEAQGIALEAPPIETTVVRDSEREPVDPLQVRPGALINGQPRPWTRDDLKGQEKFPVVPKFIPGAVHPLPDANGKYHIFLDVNGLTCCLTVHEMNVVSGMFYHAYMNIEEQWAKANLFKKKGPTDGPHVNGGWGGINTWVYVDEAPSAWIDIDGGYYQPGAEMPNEDIPLERPSA